MYIFVLNQDFWYTKWKSSLNPLGHWRLLLAFIFANLKGLPLPELCNIHKFRQLWRRLKRKNSPDERTDVSLLLSARGINVQLHNLSLPTAVTVRPSQSVASTLRHSRSSQLKPQAVNTDWALGVLTEIRDKHIVQSFTPEASLAWSGCIMYQRSVKHSVTKLFSLWEDWKVISVCNCTRYFFTSPSRLSVCVDSILQLRSSGARNRKLISLYIYICVSSEMIT